MVSSPQTLAATPKAGRASFELKQKALEINEDSPHGLRCQGDRGQRVQVPWEKGASATTSGPDLKILTGTDCTRRAEPQVGLLLFFSC